MCPSARRYSARRGLRSDLEGKLLAPRRDLPHLADEAGLSLTQDAEDKVAVILAEAEVSHQSELLRRSPKQVILLGVCNTVNLHLFYRQKDLHELFVV